MNPIVLVLALYATGRASGQFCNQADAVYSGELEAFPLYDQWLTSTSTVTPTSSCGNQELFFPTKNDKFVAIAFNPMANGLACGACVNITSSTGVSEILTVLEGINKANEGDVQLAQSTANRLGGPGVSWRFVPCPVTGTIRYQFSAGATISNSATIGFSNFILGIRAVSVQTNGAWNDLQRNSASVNWNLPSGTLTLPMKVQLTSVRYETVTFSIPAITGDGSTHDSGVTFTGACYEPPSTAPVADPKKVAAKSSSSSLGTLGTLVLALFVSLGVFFFIK